jgi:hypothetical protein
MEFSFTCTVSLTVTSAEYENDKMSSAFRTNSNTKFHFNPVQLFPRLNKRAERRPPEYVFSYILRAKDTQRSIFVHVTTGDSYFRADINRRQTQIWMAVQTLITLEHTFHYIAVSQGLTFLHAKSTRKRSCCTICNQNTSELATGVSAVGIYVVSRSPSATCGRNT